MKQLGDAEVLARFPHVLIDQDNIEHYRGLLERRLLINRCQICGYWVYPHRPMCPKCWSDNVAATQVCGEGAVYMFTLLHQGRTIPGVDYSTPHPIAAIELQEQKGLRYLATIINCPNEAISIGMTVRLAWLERSGAPSPAFVPVPVTHTQR